MSRLRKAVKATVVVQVFSILSMLVSLLTVPLYLQWLGQERYGLLLTGMAFASYLMFADVGLSWASMLLISQAHGREDRGQIASIVRTSVSLGTLSALVVAMVVGASYLMLVSSWRPAWMPGHPDAGGLVLAVGLSSVMTLFMSPFYNIFIGLQETHLAGVYQGLGRLLGVGGSLAVASTKAPLGYVFGANVLGGFVISVIAAVHCWRRYPWAFQSGAFWQREQVMSQLRTGAKSFAMQVGSVLTGTAPVLAVSTFGGAYHVPLLSVPLTLLNAPLGLVNSLNATLQPGYGEAAGRDEKEWIAETIRLILSLTLVFTGLMVAGLLVLAVPFIHFWTAGALEIPFPVLLSVIAIAGSTVLTGIFRFALTGMNRHRVAGWSELACGAGAMLLCPLAVYAGGFAWVGAGILVAVLATGGWVLPAELKRALDQTRPWIGRRFLWTLLPIMALSAGAGWLSFQGMAPLGVVASLLVSGMVMAAVYTGLIRITCPDLWAKVMLLIQRKKRLSPLQS